jgi:glutamyl-tRNA(Gln) amidotransferase subunit E
MDLIELESVLDDLIKANINIVHEQRERSIGPLMGIAMKTMRGKADGQIINQILEKKIREKLD